MWEKIGLIGAMAEEIQRIDERMEETSASDIAGIRFLEGIFCGKKVVLCKSGVGKVNAAACTQILIDRFGVDAIIFTGLAGALDPTLNIGDIVIPFADRSVFPADERLIKLAAEAGESVAEGRVLIGRVLSGDQFIADRELVRKLHTEMGGACIEMEGSAVAQVCAMNGLPYVVIRSMSDKADGSAHVNFAEFTVKAADRSFRIVEQMIRRLA